jgi:hypothetical protein
MYNIPNSGVPNFRNRSWVHHVYSIQKTFMVFLAKLGMVYPMSSYVIFAPFHSITLAKAAPLGRYTGLSQSAAIAGAGSEWNRWSHHALAGGYR